MRSLRRKEKLSSQAFREIRRYIIQNNLQAGDLLPTEQSLCDALGISRNILREAIKSLEIMGLVKAIPGRGTMVQEFNLDFIFQNVLFFSVGDAEKKATQEMLDLRRMLELNYMHDAFNLLKAEDIAYIRQCAEDMKMHWDKNELFSDIDREFHLTIYRPLNNGVLISLLNAIWSVDDGFDMEKKRLHLESTIPKHFAIVEALERNSYEDFVDAMEHHFASGKYAFSGSYEEY
ncbi:MAG: FadR/GntR family transcriptional regulator [Eubacteriales bacterium]|nr:FadR/GntR family transcriptional regulator [Eubacteriales bacterium]